MSSLLIHEPPLQVLPSLAVDLGLNEAIVLQQLHYWLQRSTTRINGALWVYNTVLQWREQFPFWSDDTISRTLKNLRERGVVVAERLSTNPFDKTLFYRIDYSKVPAPKTADCGNPKPADCGDRGTQDASFSTETTTENETTTRDKAQRKRSAQVVHPKPLDVPDQVWSDFVAMRKLKRAPVTETAIKLLRTEAERAGVSLTEALETCCANGWQGFKADWIRKPTVAPRPPGAPPSVHSGFDQIDYGVRRKL